MMVELCTWKMEMGEENENDMDDTSGHEKWGEEHVGLGLEDLVSELILAGSWLVHAILGMVNWVAHQILLSSSFSWWIPPSPLISLSCPRLYYHVTTRSFVIPRYLSIPISCVYTEYSNFQVQHHSKVGSLLLPASFSSLGGSCCTQLCTFPQL